MLGQFLRGLGGVDNRSRLFLPVSSVILRRHLLPARGQFCKRLVKHRDGIASGNQFLRFIGQFFKRPDCGQGALRCSEVIDLLGQGFCRPACRVKTLHKIDLCGSDVARGHAHFSRCVCCLLHSIGIGL